MRFLCGTLFYLLCFTIEVSNVSFYPLLWSLSYFCGTMFNVLCFTIRLYSCVFTRIKQSMFYLLCFTIPPSSCVFTWFKQPNDLPNITKLSCCRGYFEEPCFTLELYSEVWFKHQSPYLSFVPPCFTFYLTFWNNVLPFMFYHTAMFFCIYQN